MALLREAILPSTDIEFEQSQIQMKWSGRRAILPPGRTNVASAMEIASRVIFEIYKHPLNISFAGSKSLSGRV
jgi:hypothetical protein